MTETDTIFISGLALHAYHGVMPHEGKVGQSFKLDITLDIDLGEAARSDRLRHTVSYDQVAAVATEAFCSKRYKLIEAAAGAVIDALLQHISAGHARAASPCTSRMRRSPRPSTMSA